MSVDTVTDSAQARSRLPLLLCLFLVAATVALYYPMLGGELTYDSRAQILIDDYIHQPGNVASVVSLRVLSQDVMNRRRPALLLSLMLDSAFWGQQAFGYHLSNVVIHAANTALLFGFLIALATLSRGDTGSSRRMVWGCFLGALLFAVHPVNSEAVCNVSYRGDLLSVLFLVPALWMGMLLRAGHCRRHVWCGVFCCVLLLLAAASKESGAVGPILMLVVPLAVRGEGIQKAWALTTVSAFVVVGIFVALAFGRAPEASAIFTGNAEILGGSLPQFLRTQPRIWAAQLLHILFPQGLSADYTPYSLRGITPAMAVWSLVLFLALAVHFSRGNRPVVLGAMFLALCLLPTSNLLPMYRPMADRFLYMPMVAAAVIVSAAGRNAWSRPANRVLVTVGLVVAVLAACVTLRREHVWRDRVTLWQNTAAKNPTSIVAFNNLGFAYYDRGEYRNSLKAWREALVLTKGRLADSWAGMAVSLDAVGQHRLSEEAWRRATVIDATYGSPDQLVASLRWSREQADRLARVVGRAALRRP
ncbi:MAG: hypothetical protein HQ559_03240 [Lentisphaerae bacterium]|nr:hypothetical protein [Lentisphaerota bacterium]